MNSFKSGKKTSSLLSRKKKKARPFFFKGPAFFFLGLTVVLLIVFIFFGKNELLFQKKELSPNILTSERKIKKKSAFNRKTRLNEKRGELKGKTALKKQEENLKKDIIFGVFQTQEAEREEVLDLHLPSSILEKKEFSDVGFNSTRENEGDSLSKKRPSSFSSSDKPSDAVVKEKSKGFLLQKGIFLDITSPRYAEPEKIRLIPKEIQEKPPSSGGQLKLEIEFENN